MVAESVEAGFKEHDIENNMAEIKGYCKGILQNNAARTKSYDLANNCLRVEVKHHDLWLIDPR